MGATKWLSLREKLTPEGRDQLEALAKSRPRYLWIPAHNILWFMDADKADGEVLRLLARMQLARMHEKMRHDLEAAGIDPEECGQANRIFDEWNEHDRDAPRSLREIAKRLGVGLSEVRRVKDGRSRTTSSQWRRKHLGVPAFQPRIRGLRADHPGFPGSLKWELASIGRSCPDLADEWIYIPRQRVRQDP